MHLTATNPIHALYENFLGNSPLWYKNAIIGFLIINPILWTINPTLAGWALVLEFIFTLAMALKCYPLIPGGLLAIEALFIGMTNTDTVLHEIESNLPVLLLLIFMVAGIYFMKDLLFFSFNRLLIKVKSKVVLSLFFCIAAAILSAFLDALTVIAVIISVAAGFYGVYYKAVSARVDGELDSEDLDKFRAFLRSIMMHAAVGTALGGVCTLVGEPQNLLIAERAHWHFGEFFLRMSPITIPVLFSGLLVCILVEKFKLFGYGEPLPQDVRRILENVAKENDAKRTLHDKVTLIIQGLIGIWLVTALALHLTEVGLIGLSVIVLATAFSGITDEHQIGKAFEEALPFTALLVVFFVIVAAIQDNGLFTPIINFVLVNGGEHQTALFYIANGVLSAISDNVFVATVYVGQITEALANGLITRDQFDNLSVAINTGTNIPSVATPNGQAAFLFLLTSSIAPLIRLSYGTMVKMALPYTIVMSLVGLSAVYYGLEPMTNWMYDTGLINHHIELPEGINPRSTDGNGGHR